MILGSLPVGSPQGLYGYVVGVLKGASAPAETCWAVSK